MKMKWSPFPGSFKEETRGTDCVVRGKYGYVDPDGNKREFTYVSGITSSINYLFFFFFLILHLIPFYYKPKHQTLYDTVWHYELIHPLLVFIACFNTILGVLYNFSKVTLATPTPFRTKKKSLVQLDLTKMSHKIYPSVVLVPRRVKLLQSMKAYVNFRCQHWVKIIIKSLKLPLQHYPSKLTPNHSYSWV